VFTLTDPMPYGPGTPFENAYAYARNNPQLMNDPTGLRATRAGSVRLCFLLDFGCILGYPGVPSPPPPIRLPELTGLLHHIAGGVGGVAMLLRCA
jgi:hypothetical protein